MKQHYFLSFLLLLSVSFSIQAQTVQERIIYNTNFQDWETASSTSTPNIISKTTVQGEELDFTLLQTKVVPNGTHEKFTADVSTEGYMMMEKNPDAYIELSALASVTSIKFVQAATGGTRGITLKVKGKNDEDWIYLHNKSIVVQAGEEFQYEVNKENVSIRFENFNGSQNAYLLSLEIKGNVEITSPQASISTDVLPNNSGSIKQTPMGTQFDLGTEITLNAEANFGYKFLQWLDDEGNILSTNNPYSFFLDKDVNITAEFVQKNTYSLQINTVGGANNYLVTASPKGEEINGTMYYEEGTEIQLFAENNRILTFTNWDDNTTEATKTFTITDNTQIMANYSAVDFIVAWDLHLDDPNSQRAGDYAFSSENQGMLSLRQADGTTSSWLKKGIDSGKYEGRYSAVNWRPINDKYYFEISFSTTGFSNISVEAAMLYNFNTYSVQKVQYSLDGTIFEDLGNYLLEDAKAWYEKSFDLPQAAEEQAKVYVRFIPDYDSPIVGASRDNDGAAITDIFVIAERNEVQDNEPPILVSSIPGNTDSGISANGSIVLTFDKRVFAGTGNCYLNNEILESEFSGKTVVFNYSGLSYNTPYTFTVPNGAITNKMGNAFEGCEISFTTMEKAAVEARIYDLIVAADGSGDYTTVSEAIAASPVNRVSPYLIFIKEGIYNEHVEIPENKPHIHLIGQDVDKVVITDNRLCGDADGQVKYHVSEGATVVVLATDFFAENISFENSWGVENNAGPQALAMYSNNDRFVLNKCKLRSYQDTYLTSTKNIDDRHYLKNCFIEGAVDFIYGAGNVFFDKCNLNIVRKSGGYIVAPSHKLGTAWGYVFRDNTITAPISETNVWLGRPWKDSPKAVYINTKSEVTIPAAGWYETMGAIPAIFADYNTMDADGNPLDLSNRIEDYWYINDNGEKIEGKAKNYLTDEEAAGYTIKNVLSGNDIWQPTLLTESIDAPIITGNMETISWEQVPYTICYVITKNGKVVDFVTENSFVGQNDKNGDIYVVQAANEYGGLSEKSNEYTVDLTPNGLSENSSDSLIIYANDTQIFIKGINVPSKIQVYNLSGMLVKYIETAGDLDFSVTKGSYIVRVTNTQQTKNSIVIAQ